MNRQDLESMLANLYRHTGADRFFEPPQLKVAAAEDPFFERFKTVIGPQHWTPQEVMA